ncbi:DgyrCDS4004 [Dimorphilus gyrociliatus]|uniref:DgyrCDS4004 n=1 Tax=Dimorphilus gyrociliatus TaxID=2664684 RepID=A0A7I8VG55_9ANNE|nr:DgyrCDS4004 [Dimorphilus gyrociliatus]
MLQEREGLVLVRGETDSNAMPMKLRLGRDIVELHREELVCVEPNDIDSSLLSKERTVIVHRGGGGLGISVKGGHEHNLPILISRIFKGQAADRTRSLYVGDAILSVNGANVTKLRHDEAVQCLKHAGNDVTLVVKYFRPASLFLGQQDRENDNAGMGKQLEIENDNIEIDDQHVPLAPIKKEWKLSTTIPLLFAHISLSEGEKGSTSFQIQSANDSIHSGLIMCENAFSCSEWFNDIFNNISALNYKRMKEFNNSIYPSKQVMFMSWVKEKITNVAWAPTFLCLCGMDVYLFEQPPASRDDWEVPEKTFKIYESVFRILKQSECADDRKYCCIIENAKCNKVTQTVQKCYMSVDSRQQLLKLEKAWHCANATAVTTIQNITYGCSWNDRLCGLTLDLDGGIALYDNDTKNNEWAYQFSQLKSSRDDGKSALMMNFTNENGMIETRKIESTKMFAIIFCLHSFLAAKLAFVDPIFLQNVGL